MRRRRISYRPRRRCYLCRARCPGDTCADCERLLRDRIRWAWWAKKGGIENIAPRETDLVGAEEAQP